MTEKENTPENNLMPSLLSGINDDSDDDSDYIERLLSFGEGYCDFTIYDKIFDISLDTE